MAELYLKKKIGLYNFLLKGSQPNILDVQTRSAKNHRLIIFKCTTAPAPTITNISWKKTGESAASKNNDGIQIFDGKG